MKSSSNLIQAETTAAFTRDWAPTDFGGGSSVNRMDPEVVDPVPFEDLGGPQVHWKEANPEPAGLTDFGGTEETQPAATGNNGGGNVRRWCPNEVRPLVTETAAHQPRVEVSSAVPSLEEMRARLIQEAMAEAGKILTQAQAQAADLVRQAQDRAQEISVYAHQQGWDAARSETVPMIQTVNEIVEQVRNWSEEMYSQSQGAVFSLVQQIAQALFSDGFALDSEMLQQTFNRVMANARSLGDLRIFVNPEDAINLGPYWREYQESVSGQQMEIIPSESIKRGGCFVDGQLGTVDGRVETQFKAIMDALSTSMDDQEKHA